MLSYSSLTPSETNPFVKDAFGISYFKIFILIIVGALIFLATALWRDLFVKIGERYLPKQSNILYSFAYTILLTAIIVLIIIVIVRKTLKL